MQVYEKYVNLARDAASSGDRIAAESYQQYAEHYYRIINDTTDPQRPAPQPAGSERPGGEPGEAEQSPAEHGGRERQRGGRQPYPMDAEQPFVDGQVPAGASTPASPAAPEGNGQAPEAGLTAEEDGEAAKASPPEEAKPKARGRGRPRTRAKAGSGAAAKDESDGAANPETGEPCKAGEQSG